MPGAQQLLLGRWIRIPRCPTLRPGLPALVRLAGHWRPRGRAVGALLLGRHIRHGRVDARWR